MSASDPCITEVFDQVLLDHRNVADYTKWLTYKRSDIAGT